MTDHDNQEAQVLFPFPLSAYLHDGDLEPDHDQDTQLTEGEVAFFRANALLDAIVDGRPWRVEDDLVVLLAGPFGVDWRTGQHPVKAPPTTWEPAVLELGHDVAEAMHLDPRWDHDPAQDA